RLLRRATVRHSARARGRDRARVVRRSRGVQRVGHGGAGRTQHRTRDEAARSDPPPDPRAMGSEGRRGTLTRPAIALCLLAAACRAGPAPLRLGTTYTVQQSGALTVLESHWTGAPLVIV